MYFIKSFDKKSFDILGSEGSYFIDLKTLKGTLNRAKHFNFHNYASTYKVFQGYDIHHIDENNSILEGKIINGKMVC